MGEMALADNSGGARYLKAAGCAVKEDRPMPKLAANLSMMFTEIDFLDRFAAAKRHGFKGVEFLFPYAFPKDRVAEALKSNGLELALHNMPPGNWDAGERGLACLPDRVSEFRDGVGLALDYAKTLGNKLVHAMAGLAPKGISAEKLRQTYVENIRYAADRAKEAGLRIVLEPINTRDIPGYYLNYSRQALELMDEIGRDNVLLQYDIYHMQIMEGDLARTIEANLSRIGHMQLADNPGRNEPGTGEINYKFLFGFIDRIGYQGWIGCEYKPKAGTEAGVGWLKEHGVG
jgi:hydroxypyruvate isomerase